MKWWMELPRMIRCTGKPRIAFTTTRSRCRQSTYLHMILILLSDWLHEQRLLSPTRQRPAERADFPQMNSKRSVEAGRWSGVKPRAQGEEDGTRKLDD